MIFAIQKTTMTTNIFTLLYENWIEYNYVMSSLPKQQLWTSDILFPCITSPKFEFSIHKHCFVVYQNWIAAPSLPAMKYSNEKHSWESGGRLVIVQKRWMWGPTFESSVVEIFCLLLSVIKSSTCSPDTLTLSATLVKWNTWKWHGPWRSSTIKTLACASTGLDWPPVPKSLYGSLKAHMGPKHQKKIM